MFKSKNIFFAKKDKPRLFCVENIRTLVEYCSGLDFKKVFLALGKESTKSMLEFWCFDENSKFVSNDRSSRIPGQSNALEYKRNIESCDNWLMTNQYFSLTMQRMSFNIKIFSENKMHPLSSVTKTQTYLSVGIFYFLTIQFLSTADFWARNKISGRNPFICNIKKL